MSFELSTITKDNLSTYYYINYMNQTVKINLFYCLYILNEEIKLGTKLNYLFYKFSFYIFTAGAGAAKRGWGLHRNPVVDPEHRFLLV